MPIRVALVAAGLVFLILIGCWAVFYKPVSPVTERTHLTPIGNDPTAAKNTISSRPTATAEVSLGTSKPAHAEAVRPFFLDIDEAPNLKIFIERARQKSGHGGLFYEQRAKDICFVIQQVLEDAERLPGAKAADHATAVQRENALRHLRVRCESLLPAELGLDERSSSIDGRRALISQDPMLAAFYRSLAAKGKKAEEQKAMQEILSFGDPVLLAKIGSSLSEGKLYFDRVFYTSPKQIAVFGAAKVLVGCHLGQVCGPNDLMTLEMCATEGYCAASRLGAIRLRLAAQFGQSDNLALEAESLAISIADAVRKREAAKFIAPGR